MVQAQFLAGRFAGQYGYVRETEGIFNTVFNMAGQLDVLLPEELRVVFPVNGKSSASDEQGTHQEEQGGDSRGDYHDSEGQTSQDDQVLQRQ